MNALRIKVLVQLKTEQKTVNLSEEADIKTQEGNKGRQNCQFGK